MVDHVCQAPSVHPPPSYLHTHRSSLHHYFTIMSQLQPNPAIVPVPVLAAAAGMVPAFAVVIPVLPVLITVLVSLITAAAVPIPGTEGPTETVPIPIPITPLFILANWHRSSSASGTGTCSHTDNSSLVPRDRPASTSSSHVQRVRWLN